MDELSLYESIFGLKHPWSVESVALEDNHKQVVVKIFRCSSQPLRCPKCQNEVPGYDHRTRRWRHLDTCQYKTFVEAQVPRVNCPEHGCLTVEVPWADERSCFTQL